jgi:aldehyde dehydrogenase (NAD+)
MEKNVSASLQKMQDYFKSGATQSYSFRKKQLQALKKAIKANENQLQSALFADLRKNAEETWVTETGFVLNELNYTLANLEHWMQKEYVDTNLLNFPGTSYIKPEPMGTVLIIGPWNYPLQLILVPLIGAIAAGNCVVIKPSEFAPATLAAIKVIIETVFKPEYVLLMEGEGSEVVPALMNNFRFDLVFYTGSPAVGKAVYKMAAENLVPVVLELGGKSPCVVESDANIKVTARRIAQAKFSNAGQMCIAPDYILVHSSVKEKLLQALKQTIEQFFGTNPAESYDYGRIINTRQFDRLSGYLQNGNIITGGQYNREDLYIAPTVLSDIQEHAAVMQEEIFGPILPVLVYNSMQEALDIIARHPNPLAFYIYSGNAKRQQEWLQAVPSGNACINTSSMHATNHHLPFGGRGTSGIGAYHGKHSFTIFSHKKGVLKSPTWFDPAAKYPSLKGKLGLLKKIV